MRLQHTSLHSGCRTHCAVRTKTNMLQETIESTDPSAKTDAVLPHALSAVVDWTSGINFITEV